MQQMMNNNKGFGLGEAHNWTLQEWRMLLKHGHITEKELRTGALDMVDYIMKLELMLEHWLVGLGDTFFATDCKLNCFDEKLLISAPTLRELANKVYDAMGKAGVL